MSRLAVYTQHVNSVGPPLAHQRNNIQMVFRWRADGGPLLHVNWVPGCLRSITHSL